MHASGSGRAEAGAAGVTGAAPLAPRVTQVQAALQAEALRPPLDAGLEPSALQAAEIQEAFRRAAAARLVQDGRKATGDS